MATTLCYRFKKVMTNSASSPGRWLRRGLRLVGWIATIALVGFHAWLFAGRLRDASLTQPEVQLRWALAAALLGLALFFRRRGLSLLRGRPAIVFWLLALLLHLGPVPLPATLGPVTGLLVALPWALAAPLVALLGRRFARSMAPQYRRSHRREAPRARHASLLVRSPRSSPRPPPAA